MTVQPEDSPLVSIGLPPIYREETVVMMDKSSRRLRERESRARVKCAMPPKIFLPDPDSSEDERKPRLAMRKRRRSNSESFESLTTDQTCGAPSSLVQVLIPKPRRRAPEPLELPGNNREREAR